MAEPLELKPKAAESGAALDKSSRLAMARFSAVEFLIALALLLVSAPLVEKFSAGDSIEAVLITVMLVSGVMVVGRRRWALIVAMVLMLPAVAGKWLHHFRPDLVPPEAFLFAELLFIIFVVLRFLWFILRAPRVNTEVLCAGVSVYLLLGLMWTVAYLMVARMSPTAFAFSTGPAASQTMTGFNAYYFSFVTLSTVGYGDITPVSSGARALAVIESTTGTLYVAVLVARLVALYSSENLHLRKDGTH